MSLVLDASVACAWAFEDETTPALEELLDRVVDEEVFVPVLWRSEVMNVLVQSCRRERIDETSAGEFWKQLESLGLRESTFRPSWVEIVRLCSQYELSAYDANYLALALHLRAPLATLDVHLSAAAKDAGVEVLP